MTSARGRPRIATWRSCLGHNERAGARPGRRHLAFLLLSLSGGGVELMTLRIAGALADRGHRIDLLVGRPEGELLGQIPDGVRLVPLGSAHVLSGRAFALAADPAGWKTLLRPVILPVKGAGTLRHLPGLVRYLAQERPDGLFAAKTYPNLAALWARKRTGVETRVAVSERLVLSEQLRHSANRDKWRLRHLPALLHRCYPWADAILAVSDGVARDLSEVARLPIQDIVTIYNPVLTPDIRIRASEPVPHAWLEDKQAPVVLSAGRLSVEKDFPTLLRAFALLRERIPARLIIVGEGGQRAKLEKLISDLGIGEAVSLPGFVQNPYAYMAHASVFVLSSVFEGFGNVLVEALACGCPVVSTDCPGGPGEILGRGRYGRLVPVGDHAALAGAIRDSIAERTDREALVRRAEDFSVDRAANRYLETLFPP